MKKDVAFFVGVPALLALTMGLAKGEFLYPAALSFVPWWVAGLTTQCFHLTLRQPLWVLTVLGALTASVLVLPYIHLVNFWFGIPVSSGWERVGSIAISTGRAVVLWTAFVYVFAFNFGWTRYRYEPRPAGTVRHAGLNTGQAWTREEDEELARLAALQRRGTSPAGCSERSAPSAAGRSATTSSSARSKTLAWGRMTNDRIRS
jgi:hypothetical protein